MIHRIISHDGLHQTFSDVLIIEIFSQVSRHTTENTYKISVFSSDFDKILKDNLIITFISCRTTYLLHFLFFFFLVMDDFIFH